MDYEPYSTKEIDNEIYPYAYRPFDARWICYEPALIDRPRLPFMGNMLKENVALALMRQVHIEPGFSHVFVVDEIADARVHLSNRGIPYFFPLYLYPDERRGKLLDEKESKPECTPNFTPEFLQAIKSALQVVPI